MSEFDLPAERRLPDAVRESARLRIQQRLHQPPRSRRTPVLVAVATALGIGAAALAVVPGQPAVAPATRPPVNPELPLPDQDRVYRITEGTAPADAARRCAGERDQGAGQWTPIATVSRNRVDLVAFTTAAGVVFCELTPRAVTVSAPVADPGALAVSFSTATGSLAGFTGPDARRFALHATDDSLPSVTVARVGTIWLAPNGIVADRLTARREVRDSSELVVRAEVSVPAPSPTRVDQDGPAGDRTSPEGRRLGQCLAGTRQPVPDPAAWQPGQDTAAVLGESIQLGRYRGLLALCRPDGTVNVVDLTDLARTRPANGVVVGDTVRGVGVYYGFTPEIDPDSGLEYSSSTTRALVGEVLDERVATVVLSVPGHADVTAEPVAGTVALAIPNTAGADTAGGGSVTTRDATGAVLESVPLG